MAEHVKGEPYKYRHGWRPIDGVPIPKIKNLSPVYNAVPEMRGTERGKSTYGLAGTGKSREDIERIAAFRAGQVAPIKRSELSNPDTPRSAEVTPAEYARVALRGGIKYESIKAQGSEPKALSGDSWQRIKDHAFTQSRKPWGGVTIDTHTGQEVRADADAFAVTVRDKGQQSVHVDPKAPRTAFDAAMEEAKVRFAAILRRPDHHLGVFYDQDTGRIEIDPVYVTGSRKDAEDIGAYTRALGGAYHFKSGDGYWPPHIKG